MIKLKLILLILAYSFFLSGCANAGSWGAKPKNPMLGAGLQGYNHTQYSITAFSINEGYGSIGGTVCCVMIPEKWRPNLIAHIKWEKLDKSKISQAPKFSQVEAYNRWEKELDRYTTYHEAWVPIPQYDEPCSVKVHFLPCDEVKITTSCKGYGHPEYPINEPHNLKEPAVCPQK
ncbi:DUF3304 domain-containing protein [Proteus vulgaris]|uniref:DUF3304 domain-containing protein n=1 Tax=Proteus vulgaris TaxID=585 RepID=A0A6G6SPQ0_PROVU|nr:DUF3304 domain-containing protein [Proteus vulgaris]QIF95029.1 DUF3304 domain-containing protein [Proteus vulgaris]WIF71311.1 DUF3304 domain-containing protein [Proteus vulgaris]